MSDPFKNYTPGLESSATSVEAITPDDGTDSVQPSRALNVTQSGPVQIVTDLCHAGTIGPEPAKEAITSHLL